MRARSLGSLPGRVLEVWPCREENGNEIRLTARKAFPSREQKSHLCRPGAGSNINDVLVGSAITLTGSLSADSKGDEIPFVSCSPACGIAAISLVETVNMDGASK